MEAWYLIQPTQYGDPQPITLAFEATWATSKIAEIKL